MPNKKVVSLPSLDPNLVDPRDSLYVVHYQGADASDAQISVLNLIKAKDKNNPVLNVKDYGAKGDDVNDDLPAINQAIADCAAGGTVFFPPGVYRIGSRITLKKPITLKGSHSKWWEYRPSSGSSPCQIKPLPSFTDTCMVYIPDKEIYGGVTDNDSGRIENICINGNSKNTDVKGLLFEGLVRDWTVKYVDVSQTSGNCIETLKYTRADASRVNPRGLNFIHVSSYSAGLTGSLSGSAFVLDTPTDCAFDHCLAVGAEKDGFVIANPGETKFSGCRSVFNKDRGFVITGTTAVGGVQFIGCSTDRNFGIGIDIKATGTQPVQFVGLLARRDGGNGGSALPGINISGTVGAKICPVMITGLSQTIGYDDTGAGIIAPTTGIRVEYAQDVFISGTAWGAGNSLNNAGNIDRINTSQMIGRFGLSGNVDREYFSHSSQATLKGQVKCASLDTPSGVAARLSFDTDATSRWQLLKSNTPESGTAGGSDLTLNRYDNTGAYLDTPITITRANGTTTFNKDLTTGAILTANGDFKANRINLTRTGLVNGDHALNAKQQATSGFNIAGISSNSTNVDFSSVFVEGVEKDTASVSIQHTKPTGIDDSNSSGLSVELKGDGTAARGLLVNSTGVGGTTGNLLDLRNENIQKLRVSPAGDLIVTDDFSAAQGKITVKLTNNTDVGLSVRANSVGGADLVKFRDSTGVTQTSVASDGSLVAANGLLSTKLPPQTATSFGKQGEIRSDANFIYICTAPSTWKRVGIATW